MPKKRGPEATPSRAEIEREAAAELERLTRRGAPPPEVGRRTAGPAPEPPPPPPPPISRPAPVGGGVGRGAGSAGVGSAGVGAWRPGFGGAAGLPGPGGKLVDDTDDSLDDDEYEDEPFNEEEAVTELALRDWAAQSGGKRRLEDLALPRLDPASLNAQRDRALQQILDRQSRINKETEDFRKAMAAAGRELPVTPAAGINLTAARPMGIINLASRASGRARPLDPIDPPAEEPRAAPRPSAPGAWARAAATRRTPGAGAQAEAQEPDVPPAPPEPPPPPRPPGGWARARGGGSAKGSRRRT